MTVRLTRAASQTRRMGERCAMVLFKMARIPGSCRPIRMNTRPFNRKMSISHTASAWSRVPEEKKVGARHVK